jgi:hypothetical protein
MEYAQQSTDSIQAKAGNKKQKGMFCFHEQFSGSAKVRIKGLHFFHPDRGLFPHIHRAALVCLSCSCPLPANKAPQGALLHWVLPPVR